MYQIEPVPLDTASADSVIVPPAFFPLQAQDAYVFPYNDALKQSLDSAVYMPQQDLSDSSLVAVRLFNPVTEKTVSPKPAGSQSVMILLFCLYGLLVSLNRLRFSRGSDASGRTTISRLLPNFFVKQQEMNSPLFSLSLFFPICLGFSLCLSVFASLFGRPFPVYLCVLGCFGYGVFKLLYRYLSALLLDVSPLSADFMQRKWIAYYNMLLLLVPFVFLCFVYPLVPVFYLFCLFLATILIYLIFSAITIFSSRLKLHGIFLYFCTLEIVPVILIAVYFLRY